jgi:hypothetical protein
MQQRGGSHPFFVVAGWLQGLPTSTIRADLVAARHALVFWCLEAWHSPESLACRQRLSWCTLRVGPTAEDLGGFVWFNHHPHLRAYDRGQ